MPNSDTSLQVKIGDIQLRNPIILSPGPCGRSPASMKQYADAGCAAVCSKTLSSEPWEGNPNPKKINLTCEWMINAEGGPNIGIDAFTEKMKAVRDQINECKIIISVVGKTKEEFVALAIKAQQMGADILDLDITCPNAGDKGTTDSWQKDLDMLSDLVNRQSDGGYSIVDKIYLRLWNAFGDCQNPGKRRRRCGCAPDKHRGHGN